MSKIYNKIKGLRKANKVPEVQEPQRAYYEDTHRTYSCIHCRTQLASHVELISKLFQGNHGRAYLFNKVINISCKQAVKRQLLTGPHAVADIYCDKCETILGWKYEQAFVPSQKYKEGKYIIELVHMYKENEWDITSYNAHDVIREINQSNRQKYDINDFKIGDNYFGSVVCDLNKSLANPIGCYKQQQQRHQQNTLAIKQHQFQELKQQPHDITVDGQVDQNESGCVTTAGTTNDVTRLGNSNNQEASQPTNVQNDKTPDSQPAESVTKVIQKPAAPATTFVGLRCSSLTPKVALIGQLGPISDGAIRAPTDSASSKLDSIMISLNGLHSFDTSEQQPDGNARQCISKSNNSAIISS